MQDLLAEGGDARQRAQLSSGREPGVVVNTGLGGWRGWVSRTRHGCGAGWFSSTTEANYFGLGCAARL